MRSQQAGADTLFAGPGEIRAILRSVDWASTPLGPIERWPQSSRTSLRLCLDAVIPMLVMLGPDLRVIYNDACPPILGPAKHPGALGRRARDVWPEYWTLIEREIDLLMKRGQSLLREDERFMIARGEQARAAESFVTYAATPIRREDGTPVGILAVLDESTERIRQAREREEIFALALSTARMAAWNYDLVDRSMQCSAGFEGILGHERQPGQWTLDGFLEHVLEDDRAQVEQKLDDAGRNHSSVSFECRIRRRDGEIRWLWVASRQVEQPHGGHARLAGVIRDITERRRAEEALAASEKRFRALVTATSYLVYRVSPDWRELREFRGTEGGPRGRSPALNWLDTCVHPDDRAYVNDAIAGAVRARATFELEHRILRADGGSRWVFSRAVPILNQQGEIVEWFGASSDVTDRKRAELLVESANARLREADRRKDEFLAVLSHELRNPLAPIKNSLDIMDRVEPGGSQALRAKEVLERQIEQLSHLIDDLLDITRISHGKIQLHLRRLELNELVRGTIDDQRGLFERSHISVRFEAADRELFVNADWNRIAQIVSNLLQNAAKFTSGGGSVTVTVSHEGDAGFISVADTGAGMNEDTLAHLFEPFRQADTTLDRSKGGLGLGLALIKGLAEQHGGSVTALSAGLGKGSEFVVRLPLARLEGAVIEPYRVAPGGAHRRVLVIEDNVDAAESLRDALELEGHEVAIAHDGRGGIDQARAFHPEFVICDIGLPGMDGYEVARAFRADAELKQTHLVALSGYALPKDLERAAEAGFEQHLAKPANLERLTAVFEGLAGH